MRCGLAPFDCITDHWLPVLDGRREPAGWRARCPVCHKPRALSIQAGQRTIKFNCHHAPACERVAIRAELVRLLPACLSARNVGGTHIAAIEALVLDKTLTPTALRVALLLELGWNAERIRAELKMPKQTWSDAVRILGHRRSGFSDVQTASQRPDSRTAPQATESQNAPLNGVDNSCYSHPAGRRHVGVGS